MFTLYSANGRGKPSNCYYPNAHSITDEKSLAFAVKNDYVSARYQNGYRSKDNFLLSNCLTADCDNDHSENPRDWVLPEDLKQAFPEVTFAVHFSRNHLVSKAGKVARPKFHVFFPIRTVSDASVYTQMKQEVSRLFPYLDTNALDAARFFFGTATPEVLFFSGTRTLTDFLEELAFLKEQNLPFNQPIRQGSRNATMSRLAGKILVRLGDTEEARSEYLKRSLQCEPPLSDFELSQIWTSALKFYAKVKQNPAYIAPEIYGQEALRFKPSDYTDIGQAKVLAEHFSDQVAYTPSTDYLVFNGSFWEESKSKAQKIIHDLTSLQLLEAESELSKIQQKLEVSGAWEAVKSNSKKALNTLTPEQLSLHEQYVAARAYKSFVTQRRDTKYITAVQKEARPYVEVSHSELDQDAFLLNTPSATYDLRLGLDSKREHAPRDYITRQTAVDPDDKNIEIWQAALDTFFQGDERLIRYVQEIVGLSAIGKVCLEALVIAYGEGRNGKSTFWNTLARVLGSYSGNMSADTLTVGCKRNVKPELAEARGKRLLIAAELEEGMRLSTANVKQLCSTDEIYAEKKYKDPFSYVPSHTLVLYTNHLPRVGALDEGTWRRLIVIPFNATIEGKSDIKNYSDYLFENCAGAILSWIIEGAKRVIEQGFKIEAPEVVQAACQHYKANNDWFSEFLDECCEVDSSYVEKSGEVYTAYRSYCLRTGGYARSTTDFYMTLEQAGFTRRRNKHGVRIFGLRLRSDFTEI